MGWNFSFSSCGVVSASNGDGVVNERTPARGDAPIPKKRKTLTKSKTVFYKDKTNEQEKECDAFSVIIQLMLYKSG